LGPIHLDPIYHLGPIHKILLLAGQPLDEPIAARGPFVMNTQNELREAMSDYQSGKLGR
jgi:redox-sensitive bicupin YhaK (pirin superfamily)